MLRTGIEHGSISGVFEPGSVNSSWTSEVFSRKLHHIPYTQSRLALPGPYKAPNYHAEFCAVFTNKTIVLS
jgi:hypothetical protein